MRAAFRKVMATGSLPAACQLMAAPNGLFPLRIRGRGRWPKRQAVPPPGKICRLVRQRIGGGHRRSYSGSAELGVPGSGLAYILTRMRILFRKSRRLRWSELRKTMIARCPPSSTRIRRSWLVEHNYLEKAEASSAALWKVEARRHKVQIAFRQLVQQLSGGQRLIEFLRFYVLSGQVCQICL